MAFTWADLGGSTYANPELSKQAEFISAKQSKVQQLAVSAGPLGLGKNHGDTVAMKIFGRISTSATTALSENAKVPMTTFPEYTVTATVYQRGIAVPWTKLREDLDRLDVNDTVIHALREHSSRTHNELAYNALVSGRSFCYTATSSSAGNFTTNGSPSGTTASNLYSYHYRDIRKNLMKYNVPAADGDNYVACITPSQYMTLLGDSTAGGFVDVAKYGSKAEGLLNGEVGSYMKIRFVVDNDIIPDNIGSGSAYGSGFITGLDALREITVQPMMLIANMNVGGDFNRQRAVAWLSLMGWKVPWNYTSHGEGRVCHITSA